MNLFLKLYLVKQSCCLEAFQLVWYFYSLAQIDIFKEKYVIFFFKPYLIVLYYNNVIPIEVILVL